MALPGRLVLNGADYAPLTFFGVGTFLAFSGNGIYRNEASAGSIKNDGPLPIGKYWIVERGVGGMGSWFKAAMQDSWNHYRWGLLMGVMNGLLFIEMTEVLMM